MNGMSPGISIGIVAAGTRALWTKSLRGIAIAGSLAYLWFLVVRKQKRISPIEPARQNW